MALAHKDPRMNIQEYLELIQNDPEHRYEYIDGEVYMMTGGSLRHSRAALNLSYAIENLLRRKSPCIVYNSDVCFKLAEDCFLYPDVTVCCDLRDSDENSDEEQELNPRFVAEVLSPSTSARDRGIKAAFYQEHPSLKEFLLIETKSPKVQLYRRESNNRWTIYLLTQEDELELTSLDMRIPVADIYWRTRFLRRETEDL